MYIPHSFKNKNLVELQQFIQHYPFGTLITYSDDFYISHIPFLIDKTKGARGTLFGHVAKANKHWKQLTEKSSTLCIFHGPHAYISPTWYQERPEVPTWNYAVVHAKGVPNLIQDKLELKNEMNRMLNFFEPALSDQSTEEYIPQDFIDSYLNYIVGFRIEITELIGKYKLGQNRSEKDQASFLEALLQNKHSEAQTLGQFIKRCQKETLDNST